MANEAVVIIDVQNAILDVADMARRIKTDAALDALVARIATLIRRAHNHAIPVLFVQHDGQVGHRLEARSPGWQIRQEITPSDGEPVIHKSACDSFFETTLATELESRAIDRLIVAGCMTQSSDVEEACGRLALNSDVLILWQAVILSMCSQRLARRSDAMLLTLLHRSFGN